MGGRALVHSIDGGWVNLFKKGDLVVFRFDDQKRVYKVDRVLRKERRYRVVDVDAPRAGRILLEREMIKWVAGSPE